jgi:small subunit ribosomal protein S14
VTTNATERNAAERGRGWAAGRLETFAGDHGMAKQSQVLRDEKRKKLITKYAAKRAELRKRLNDPDVSIEEKLEVQNAFAKLPRNSCPTRLKRRCQVSGRPRGYYRKFGISRIALRELALQGMLPGVRKSSW